MFNPSPQKFAQSAAECLYDLSAINILLESAILSVEQEVQTLLKLNDLKTLQRRYEYFRILGTSIHDYEERFYEINTGQTVLAGIRHKIGLVDQPFVHTLLDFTPNKNDIKLLKEFSLQQFHKFKPKYLSLWLKPSLQLPLSEFEVTPSRQYVVGLISSIRKPEISDSSKRVRLEKLTDNFNYNWYSEVYEEFHRQRPDLKDWVPITDKEDIQRCLADQLLYHVYVDGGLAGLIGGYSENYLGKPAIYMAEFLLTSKFKGQGLAAVVQRKFINELPNDFELIWGTIDTKNQPSLKTALKVGRLPIRSEYFIRIT